MCCVWTNCRTQRCERCKKTQRNTRNTSKIVVFHHHRTEAYIENSGVLNSISPGSGLQYECTEGNVESVASYGFRITKLSWPVHKSLSHMRVSSVLMTRANGNLQHVCFDWSTFFVHWHTYPSSGLVQLKNVDFLSHHTTRKDGYSAAYTI